MLLRLRGWKRVVDLQVQAVREWFHCELGASSLTGINRGDRGACEHGVQGLRSALP
jgi:hypothetical protein